MIKEEDGSKTVYIIMPFYKVTVFFWSGTITNALTPFFLGRSEEIFRI